MKKKSTLLLLTVCTLLILSAGCGVKNASPVASSTGTSGNDASPVASSTGTSGNDATAKPLITLKVDAAAIQNISPGIQSDPIMQEIKKKLNIQLDITHVESPDWDKKLSALTAAGDLPDLFFVPNVDTRKLLINSHAALDAGDLVKTNGANLVSNPVVNASLQYSEKFFSDGSGKLYFIPFEAGQQVAPTWPVVAPDLRWDLYKKMGYPAINSWDDMLKVLADMQKQFPTAQNGKKAYAVSLFSEWGDWPISQGQLMLGYADVGQSMNVDISDLSKPLPELTDKNSSYWQMAKWYNKASQMGILDPDGPTEKFDQLSQKQKSGEIYFETPGWLRNNFAGQTPDQGFAAPPLINGNKFAAGVISSKGGRWYAISAKTKYPDRVMDLINFLYSPEGSRLIANGVQGQTWDNVNGIAKFNPDIEQQVIKGGQDITWNQKTGIRLYTQFTGLDGTYVDPASKQPIDIEYSTDFMQTQNKTDQVFQDYVTHYNLKTPGELFFGAKYNAYDFSLADATPLPPTDIKVIDDQINNYKNQHVFKVILAKNDAEFNQLQEQFIKDVQAMGIQKLYDWKTQAWTQVSSQYAQLSK